MINETARNNWFSGLKIEREKWVLKLKPQEKPKSEQCIIFATSI